MNLEAVGDLALHIILSKLGAEDSARAACVSTKLRASASDESLWSLFCARDLHLSQPLDPLGNLAPSFKESYQLWRVSFKMYPWSLVKRVKRCWDKLRNWLTINFPEAVSTLKKGASEADIQEVEKNLKVKLPLPTRILYRFHNGQAFEEKHFQNSLVGCPLGLIGGYAFYDHLVTVYLMPLRQVVLETMKIRRKLGFTGRSEYVVVADSCTHSGKLFFLNCTSGQLYVGTRNLPTKGQMLPCVPDALISSIHDCNVDQQQDGMLLWLEEHGRRLENGIIKLRQEENFRTISQFPEESPLCSTAITNGVKVRASAVFVPECVDLENTSEKYAFSYSIRMSLLPEGCVINGMPFSSCQLNGRHWVIRSNDVVVADVGGEAVIGQRGGKNDHLVDRSKDKGSIGVVNLRRKIKHFLGSRCGDTLCKLTLCGIRLIGYPLLRPGEEEFVYESYSSLPSSSGSIEGSFTFVPGSLRVPKGGPFEVAVARFPLQLPNYIF